ncbi:hypothetical protein ACH5RR_010350 [Cinchona calisaya]|uniref:Ubiquitin-like-conjugating enzyme ATG10 n=1 Tax=Cinchona calisaya TaxID=153742 RepID=A0ABD3AIP5_9GENT
MGFGSKCEKRDEFHIAASTFADQWNKFNSSFPQFTWVPRPNPPWLHPTSQVTRSLFPSFLSQAEGYLSVENVVILPCTTSEDCCNEGDDEEGKEMLSCSDKDVFIDDDDDDSTTLVQNHDYASHHYDFHVVYNASYQVPVLYFRACYSDGQVLLLYDVEKSLPGSSAKLLTESKWTFITQDDHPYLNRPWYTLHPCGTSERMKMLFNNEPVVGQGGGVAVAEYLVSWFSVVGQVFGLQVPFEMLVSVGQS